MGKHIDQVWLLHTNENQMHTYMFDWKSESWILSLYVSETVVKNLFVPFETYTLQDSLSLFLNNGNAPFEVCLNTITMDPYSFKLLVPEAE